jgi:hypothetical protein
LAAVTVDIACGDGDKSERHSERCSQSFREAPESVAQHDAHVVRVVIRRGDVRTTVGVKVGDRK